MPLSANLDEVARLLADEVPRRLPRHQEGAVDVGPVDLLEPREVGVYELGEDPEAGVVDQDVDAPVAVHDLPHGANGVLLAADVAADPAHVEVGRGRFQQLAAPGRDHDVAALLVERRGDGATDALAAARDECLCSVQIHAHLLLGRSRNIAEGDRRRGATAGVGAAESPPGAPRPGPPRPGRS
jgi:hypothetical protein